MPCKNTLFKKYDLIIKIHSTTKQNRDKRLDREQADGEGGVGCCEGGGGGIEQKERKKERGFKDMDHSVVMGGGGGR